MCRDSIGGVKECAKALEHMDHRRLDMDVSAEQRKGFWKPETATSY